MSLTEDKKEHPTHELTRSLSDCAFSMDLNKEIISFNRPFLKLHKLEAHQARTVKGTCCNSFVKLEICETNCILKQCLQSGMSVRYDEVKGKTLTGEDLTLIVTALPIRNAAGEIESVLEMHRDVTDEAKIHEKYKILLDKEKRAKEHLEILVDKRTKELRTANDDLKRAEVQLVHSEKMSSLGQMVAGIAHELNNPINFIHGNSDILSEYSTGMKKFVEQVEKQATNDSSFLSELSKLKDTFDFDYMMEDMEKICSSIRKGTERAADVIKGLRTFSRLDEAELSATNIHEDIDTTLMILKGQLSGIRIYKSYEGPESFVCFSSQLNQVYMNLLQNAIHAVKSNGEIYIKTKMMGEALWIEIEDTGVGIPEDIRKKIFDPFFTTKPVGEGTGLGLSVSYGIVERHGGTIEVESTLGKGTLFRIILPSQKVES